MVTSLDLKLNPNDIIYFKVLYTLAPNIVGIDKKKEYSAAIGREQPSTKAPMIVAPDLDVPGIVAKT